MVPRLSALIMHVLLASLSAYAALTNITIDDTNSTFWTWAGPWNAITQSTPCGGCTAKIDASKTFNESWHDGAGISGSCTFQGSAIYIYGIDVVNPANVTFSMSNPPMASFHAYGGGETLYQSLFFAASALDPSAEHTVTWILEAWNDGSTALFDYAVVTVDQPDASAAASTASESHTAGPAPAAHNKSKTGSIVGGVVGGIGTLALLGALLVFLRRRRRRHSLGRNTTTPIDGGTEKYDAPPSSGLFSAGYSAVSSDSEAVVGEPYQTLAVDAPAPPTIRSLPAPPSRSSAKDAGSVVLAWDAHPQRPEASRDLTSLETVEERLRNLEALTAQPPAYN
ncbi:hypothetical protein C8R44DRAFT_743771 [Mycena epipterygia]|nr:hypothetical protein C8R44DRAFT_743771 [Mycena epipterygia]